MSGTNVTFSWGADAVALWKDMFESLFAHDVLLFSVLSTWEPDVNCIVSVGNMLSKQLNSESTALEI